MKIVFTLLFCSIITAGFSQALDVKKSIDRLEDLFEYVSHTALAETYGIKNVIKEKLLSESGDEEFISTLYPNNNRRKVHLVWESDAYTNLKYIEVRIDNTEITPLLESEWNTKEGIKAGLSLERLIQLNKRPVIFNQFEIDSREAGLITNYSNGLFENMAIDINLTPTTLKSYDNILKLQRETYNSDMPLIIQAKCVIRQIRIYPPSRQSVSKSIHDLCTNNRYKESDILSIRTESNVYTGIYSKINENSSKKSLKQTGNSRGLYRISKIDDILFDGHLRTFLICTPVSFQTNSLEVSDHIYIDYYKAVEANELIFLTPGLNTAFDYSLIAYNYVPQTNMEKSNFQKEYLSMIFGESDLSKMDEFQINRLLSSSKQFLDSIYNSISMYFNLKRSSVFKLEISDYDFTQECFFINSLSKDKEFTLRENRLPKYCITNGQPLYQKGFINLFQFDGVLKFKPDEAERFLNIIKNNALEGEYNKRNVLAVGYYHWISEESAKIFIEKYNVNSSEYKYQKILDSLLIFPNSDITKPWKVLLPMDIKSVSPDVKIDIPPSFPGGDFKWRQFLERNLDANVPLRNGAPKGLYTVLIEFQVDSLGNASEYKPLTNHGYGMEDEAMRVIRKGPSWSPAIANGRQVKALHRQAILFTVQ